jgi:predicted MFS family arabinose efflux permease
MAGTTVTQGMRSYRDLLVQPGVARLVGWGLVARMPIGMISLGEVLLLRGTGSSYAEAGLVSASGALAFAVGAPVAGRLVDRRRPATVLIVYGVVYPIALVLLVTLALGSAPVWALIVGAVASGVTQPPIGPTLRMLWPSLVGPEHHTAAFAFEATAQEVFFVIGPLLVGVLTAAVSSSAGMLAAAAVSTVGVTGFVLTGPVRHCGAPHRGEGDAHLLDALSPPLVRRIVAFTVGYGVAFGAVEVAMPAFAEGHGGRSLGAVCVAAWSAGSLVGGVMAAGLRSDDPLRRLRLISLLFTGALALPLLAGSVPVMAAVMFIAGLPIAPSFALTYGMVQRAARPGTQAEVFAWLSTAVVVGVAFGAAAGGSLITHSGSDASIALGMAGAAVAALVSLLPRPPSASLTSTATSPGSARSTSR